MQQRHMTFERTPKDHRTRLPVGFVGFRPDLGQYLASIRPEYFGSQQALADAVGITRESLSRIENGRSLPLPDTIDGLLQALDLDWSDIAIAGEPVGSARLFDGTWRGDQRLEVGRALREGRQSEGLTLRVVADRCGLSVAQLSRIERGEGPRSRVWRDDPDDANLPAEFRRAMFRDPELLRLSRLVDRS